MPPPAAAQRPSPVQTAGPPMCKQRASSRLAVVDTSAASSCPSTVAGPAAPPQAAAHSPAPAEGTDAPIPEKWVEIWETCWKITEEIAGEPGCSTTDFENAMMMFQQLAEYEWGRPLEVRESHPVTVEAHLLARWRSPSPRRSRSPSHATSHRASSSSHSRSRSRSLSTIII